MSAFTRLVKIQGFKILFRNLLYCLTGPWTSLSYEQVVIIPGGLAALPFPFQELFQVLFQVFRDLNRPGDGPLAISDK